MLKIISVNLDVADQGVGIVDRCRKVRVQSQCNDPHPSEAVLQQNPRFGRTEEPLSSPSPPSPQDLAQNHQGLPKFLP